MIGTFVTRKFDSRHAFDAGRPFEVVTSTNSFTDAGLLWMWQMMAGQLRDGDGTLNDHIGSARIVVGNGEQPFSRTDTRLAGDQTDQSPLDEGYPRIEVMVEPAVDFEPDGETTSIGRIYLSSTFGENQAVFDWRERGVVTAQGVLLDRAVGDNGRKVMGAIWQCEAILELTR
jgi:hypothetical protein